ncbi:hypothetical protein D3C77_392750 [compost metagenome]
MLAMIVNCPVIRDQVEHVMIVYLFFGIGQLQKLLEELLEIHIISRVEAQLLYRILKGVSAGTGRQNQFHAVRSDLLRRHDLINLLIFQQAVLVNTGGMRESIFARNRLIHLYIKSRQMAYQSGGSKQLPRIDIGITLIEILSYLKRHNHFLQRSITRSLTESVNGAFDFLGSVLDCSKRIGGSQPKIIMAVDAQDDFVVQIFKTFMNFADHIAKFLGYGIADSIGHINHRCSRIND